MKVKLPSGKNIPKGEMENFKQHVINIKNKIYIASHQKELHNSLAFSSIENNYKER